MNILGISCFFHDAAAALIRDGEIIAAAEEERFTRKKHDYEFPLNAIKFCLSMAAMDTIQSQWIGEKFYSHRERHKKDIIKN